MLSDVDPRLSLFWHIGEDVPRFNHSFIHSFIQSWLSHKILNSNPVKNALFLHQMQ